MDPVARMEELLSDSWLRRKVDRNRRIPELRQYIDNYLPEMKTAPKGSRFVDIGPGPGELLELAMAHGMDAIGFDAASPEGGMGSEYLEYCRLAHQQNGVEVVYCKPGRTELNVWTRTQGNLIVNMRGSVEQVLGHLMIGPPHHLHQNCKNLSWNEDCEESLVVSFKLIGQTLLSGGVMMVAGNGAKNTDWYDGVVMKRYEDMGFSNIIRFDNRTHKLTK